MYLFAIAPAHFKGAATRIEFAPVPDQLRKVLQDQPGGLYQSCFIVQAN
jgi:hypothetical protein